MEDVEWASCPKAAHLSVRPRSLEGCLTNQAGSLSYESVAPLELHRSGLVETGAAGARGHAGGLADDTREVALVGESSFVGDVGQGAHHGAEQAARGVGDPVLFPSNPDGMSRELRRTMLGGLAEMNHFAHESVAEPEITTRVARYEMAFKIRASAPDLTGLSGEPQSVPDLYGPDVKRIGPGQTAEAKALGRRAKAEITITPGISSAHRTTHIETHLEAFPLTSAGAMPAAFSRQQVQSYRIKSK